MLLPLFCLSEALTTAPHLQPPPPLIPPGGGVGRLPHKEDPHNILQLFPYGIHDRSDDLGGPSVNAGGWDDDDGWWDGVEEIDLTQRPPEYNDETQLYLVPLQEDDDNDNQYDCFLNIPEDVCDLGKFPRPPPELFVPPPPLPPFLPGLAPLAQSQRPTEQDECLLCHWAEHGNLSSTLLAGEQGEVLSSEQLVQYVLC